MKLSDAKLNRIRAFDPYRARKLAAGDWTNAGPYTKSTTQTRITRSVDSRDLVALIDTPKEVISDWKIVEYDTINRIGTRNPEWKKRIHRNDYVGSEYSLDRVSYERSDQNWAFTKTKQYWDDWGRVIYGQDKFWREGGNPVSLLDPPSISASVLASLDQKALKHLAQKTKDSYQKISGLTFLGELRETLKMIRSPALALRKATSTYLSLLKRRATNARSHRDLRRAVNSTYLEFTYGAQPLASDVEAGARAFAEVLNRRENDGFRPIRSKRFGYSKETMISHDPNQGIPFFFPASTIYVDRKVIQKEEAFVSYWTMQDFRLARWKRPDAWWTTFGITPAEFLPSLWNVLPWSFVADYFTNIGDILEFESTDWSKIVDCFRQTRTATSYEVWDQPNGAYNMYVWALSGWTDSGLSKAVKRRETFKRERVDIRNQHLDFEFQIVPEKVRQIFNLTSLATQLAATNNVVRSRNLQLNRRYGHSL